MIHPDSFRFLGMRYPNGLPRRLKVYDKVIVHPARRWDGVIISTAKEPFEAWIITERKPWKNGSQHELCTWVPGGHSAVINDYLFSRLQYKHDGWWIIYKIVQVWTTVVKKYREWLLR